MLRLENIKKAFIEPGGEPLPILDIPQFAVAPGEQVVLVGRSGCGKTTLLHIIAGIIRPDAGSVTIDDLDIARLPEAARDRFRADHLGYVFQTFNLLPGFSALENVLLGMSFACRRPDLARAKHLLGSRRARAAACTISRRCSRSASSSAWRSPGRWPISPKLLLADEPTANVDAKHQQQIIDLIRETCREETSPWCW